jgi:hypothetical protein
LRHCDRQTPEARDSAAANTTDTGRKLPRRSAVHDDIALQKTPAIPAIPLRDLLPWALFIGVLMLMLVYFVGAEQGASSVFSGRFVHELVHDARHLLGFPCH